jgi:acetyltransferase
MSLAIATLTPDEATTHLPDLIALLVDSVDNGASVGYLAPMDAGMARKYWQGVIDAVAGGDRVLWLATLDSDVVGTAQLSLERRPNGDHRGEVSKVLVHSSARRKGIGRALMTAVETRARTEQRTLLVLDTVEGDAGQRLYESIGYVSAGVIPGYAKSSKGGFDPTNVMFKMLEP